ncbi:MAG: DUF4386 domain-containing protein [Candidatus Bathyarchaeota archaeon]|nr:DUF4386 domain-containing protein [Candidatus Bathyarchaeota archaeon]
MKTKLNPRNTARIVGLLFIIATAAPLLSVAFVPPIFGPDSIDNVILLADNETSTRLGILLEFTMAVAVASIPITMYPILKKINQSMALGYVAGRLVEGIMFTIGAICMLTLLSHSKAAVQTFAVDTVWTQLSLILLSIRSAESVFAQFSFSLGSLMFYYMLYKTELIPRWLAGWSLIGALLFLVSAFLVMLGLDSGSSLYIGLNAPGGLGEMVFALWLIIKGFNPSAESIVEESQ